MSNLIEDYIRLADQWRVAMSRGDSAQANAIHDQIHSLHQIIASLGEEDVLMQHGVNGSDAARLFMASHLKERGDPLATSIYEQLVSSELPFIALSARYILLEMKK